MKKQIMNPYLPLWEYIPDGEPRIFGDRLYVYGSHDFAGGYHGYCPGDYMAWSAPLNDLSDWKCHGVLYPRSETPNLAPEDAMAAPDVVKGPDGKFYLYYNTNGHMACHVGVSDSPSGPFTYYGDVSNADGTPYTKYKMFDPGVLVDDDGKVYLYVGFCMPGPVPEQFRGLPSPFADWSIGFQLSQDMKTILEGPVNIIPGGNFTEGTGFEGHGFFEASSPRKINGKYVMTYSAEVSHEMAYALADKPLGPYTFAGSLVSAGDLGLDGNTEPKMPYGNVHGSVVQLGGDWYIFYHRQTSGIECARQGCAEKLPIRPDGWFGMAEITSCGLNNAPLVDEGRYNAAFCCHLTGDHIYKGKMDVRTRRTDTDTCIWEETNPTNPEWSVHYIANIQPITEVGFKYFDFHAPKAVSLRVRGEGTMKVTVKLDRETVIGEAEAKLYGDWQEITIPLANAEGVHGLYFTFDTPKAQFESFAFIQ